MTHAVLQLSNGSSDDTRRFCNSAERTTVIGKWEDKVYEVSQVTRKGMEQLQSAVEAGCPVEPPRK
jgi:hypothetical protein